MSILSTSKFMTLLETKLADDVVALSANDPDISDGIMKDIASKLAKLLETDPNFKKKLMDKLLSLPNFRKRLIKFLVKEMAD